jgi:hypothetical protein
MPDPSDIRRRREAAIFGREQAEQDEAQFLLDRLNAGASIITDDAANRTQSTRESARLRGENVDGSILPSIGIPQQTLPETFGDELLGRLGESANPAAMELMRADSDRLDAGRSAVPRGGPTAPQPAPAAAPQARRGPSPFNESLMNQIVPGSDGRMVLPETEDWEAFGNTPGAGDLAVAQRSALRSLQGESAPPEGKTITPTDSARIRSTSARRAVGRPDLPFNPPADPAEAATRRADALTQFAENDARRASAADTAGRNAIAPAISDSPHLTALGLGTFQGMAQGFGDEALGMVDMLRGDNYEQSRDTYRSMFDAASEAAPITSGASRIAGAVGSGFMAPELAAARPATFLGALGRGALTGAASGALTGVGVSEANDSAGLLRDAGRSAAIGGVFGGALGGAGYGVQRLAQRVAGTQPALASEAARQRLAALGANRADMEAAGRHFPGGVEGLAEQFRGMGLTSPSGTPGSFRETAEAALRNSGEEMQGVLSRARSAQSPPVGALDATMPGSPGAYRGSAAGPAQGTRIPVDQFLADIHNDLVSPASRGTTNTSQAQVTAMQQWLERVAERYPDGLGADDLQSLKRELQESVFQNRRDPSSGATAQAYNSLQQNVRGRLDSMLDDIGQRINQPGLARTFQGARRTNQAAHLADEWIQGAQNRGSANNVMQPLAEIHAAAGGGLPGLATGVIRQVLRNRQHSLAAEGLERAGQRFAGAPEAARTALGRTTRIGAPLVAQGAAAATATRSAPAAPAPLELSAEEEAILGDVAPDSNEPTQLSAEEEALLFGE